MKTKTMVFPFPLMVLLLLSLLAMGWYMILNLPRMTSSLNVSPSIPTVSDPVIEQMLNKVVVDSYSHALEEHPNSAPKVWECMHKNGPYMQFQVIPGKRYLRICLIDDETIGFQIVDIVGKIAKERTAYIKDEIRTLPDLLRWVGQRGYCRFKGAL